MDPVEEMRDMKRKKEYISMLGYVADSEYGIQARCPCGGTIMNEVSKKDDDDTLPGKRFFTCRDFEADGLHYRQPWVFGVQEEIERLIRRVEEAEKSLIGQSYLQLQIDSLKAEVETLKGEVANLSDQVSELNKPSL